MTQVPTGWTDDGQTLKAPDGTPVKLGFRDHILNSNWDPGNVPLEPEQHLDLVEQSNPSLGPGQAQTFRWKRLGYTPKMGVYESWLGQELVWYTKAFAQAQAALIQLKAENADLREQLASGQTIPQAVKDDIVILVGNVAKLAKDAGV